MICVKYFSYLESMNVFIQHEIKPDEVINIQQKGRFDYLLFYWSKKMITMRDHDLNEETKNYLQKLSAPLNVDKSPYEIAEAHEELQLDHDDITYQKEKLESDLGDYKTELEELEEKVQDFKMWLADINIHKHTKSALLDDVRDEFKNLFDL